MKKCCKKTTGKLKNIEEELDRDMGSFEYATFELEAVLDDLTENHGLQWGEVLALVHNWLSVHSPGSQEEYEDGSNPIYYYGPKKG